MQIVIPMSGFGERFRRAGYEVPKPLIKIDEKPIIAHVIDMFPGDKNFIFICNQDHLDSPEYRMKEILKEHCPNGKIVGIKPHKLGPVYAVSQVREMLNLSEPVIVNYCDFTCYWDWEKFKECVILTNCTGCIPAYKGFHPHSLGKTNYAYMLENNGWVQDIQEKQPYTKDRINEYASSGTYYFKTANIMLQAFDQIVAESLNINGEYYVSLAYKPLLKRKEPIAVYPLQHFMQWGTPEDVAEYKYWSKAFETMTIKQVSKQIPSKGVVLIPMAGLGKRFADEGFELTKPLIPVSGKPMVVQATSDLPSAEKYIFVLRKDMKGYEDIKKQLKHLHPDVFIKTVDYLTNGQACTALIGLESLDKSYNGSSVSITIGACDNGVLYDNEEFNQLSSNPSVDVIVWGVRHYANAARHPKMYGWINAEKGVIRSISVKKPLERPESDPIVLGTFTFRRSEDFCRAIEELIKRDGKINGEYYIDSLINDAIALGLKCHLFEVDSYLCWGTPNDLRTFEYWQSCFHKWSSHPYRLELDDRIPANKLSEIDKRYRAIVPTIPEATR